MKRLYNAMFWNLKVILLLICDLQIIMNQLGFVAERKLFGQASGATVVRRTKGREVGGSMPASAAYLAESSGLETATYLYLVSRYPGTISVMYANDGCMTPKCS